MSESESACHTIEPLLSDYADGELSSSADRARIEAHLAKCQRCSSDVAFFRATNFVISQSLPDVMPPAELFLRTARATYARPTLRAQIANWLAPPSVRIGLGSALAAAVVVAVVVPIAQPQGVALEPSAPVADRPNVPGMPTAATSVTTALPVVEGFEGTTPPPTLGAGRSPVSPYRVAKAPRDRQPAKIATGNKVAVQAARIPLAAPAGHGQTKANQGPAALAERLSTASLLVPTKRVQMLADRHGIHRTLPNGDTPTEFLGPNPTLSAAGSALIARGVPVESTSPNGSAGDETSPARTVVGAPAAPRGFRLTLAEAGTGRPIAMPPIQAHLDRNAVDNQNEMVPRQASFPIVMSDVH